MAVQILEAHLPCDDAARPALLACVAGKALLAGVLLRRVAVAGVAVGVCVALAAELIAEVPWRMRVDVFQLEWTPLVIDNTARHRGGIGAPQLNLKAG